MNFFLKNGQEVYEKAKKVAGVILTGYVSEEDLVMFIQGADAMIFPSLHEGFGLPPLEAMSCGIPVIVSNVSSLPELVGNGGLFVDPYNTNDITDKMFKISRNEALRESLARNALKKSMDYSWSKTATMLLKLLEENIECEFNNFDFEECLDLAAYRTLTTVCEIIPELMAVARHDLLQANYTRVMHWALEVGLEHPSVKHFLMPFEEWLTIHSQTVERTFS